MTSFHCQALNRVHVIMKDVFLVFPNYCLGRGLMDIAFNQYKNEFYFKTGMLPLYMVLLCAFVTYRIVRVFLCGGTLLDNSLLVF